jgi:type III pantothenate kinase
MSVEHVRTIVAVDIGNTRIKLGRFTGPIPAGRDLPEPASVHSTAPDDLFPLAKWLEDEKQPCDWYVSSVNRTGTTRLTEWRAAHRPSDSWKMLSAADLPLQVGLPHPEKVGNDRLAAAVAANHLRTAGRAALVVDLGTALTVNLISPEGVFLGGAILPGLGTSAVALHEMTDLLPLVNVHGLKAPPEALGSSTSEAMLSGLYWGAVGAIRALGRELGKRFPEPPEMFVTGGFAEPVLSGLDADAHHLPHLTLAGIALAAAKLRG